jgi:hypothetical protein
MHKTRAKSITLPANPAHTAARIAATISMLWLGLALSWITLSSVNFIYPLVYEWLDIDQTILHYAPQHQSKQQFPLRDKSQHSALFQQMLHAVNFDGDGLADIKYRDASGKPIDTLLTPAERQHLQDVADLIALFKTTTILLCILLVMLLFWFRNRSVAPPRLLPTLIGTTLTLGFFALVILMLGPVKIFYGLHTLVFGDHQWFFYYQESFMTTLMQAPNFFGVATPLLVILSLIFYAALLRLTHYITLSNRHKVEAESA